LQYLLIKQPSQGSALAYLIAVILALKGYRVRGVMGIDMRTPWINRFLTLVTPTHYTRRYHESGTTLADLEGE